MSNWQDIKELEAVRALIKHEIADDYGCWFEVSRIVDSEFEVSFDKFCRFKGLTIRVIEVNEQKPEFSQFSVRVDDDYWEAFTAVDWTIKELWKALLWRYSDLPIDTATRDGTVTHWQPIVGQEDL